jgi:hypothetical protein
MNRQELQTGGRDTAVGTATPYGLDGTGIESRWGEILCTRPDRPWGPPSLLYNRYRGFPGVQRPGSGVDNPTPSSAEVKEKVHLYRYSPSGPSWPILGLFLPFLYYRPLYILDLLQAYMCFVTVLLFNYKALFAKDIFVFSVIQILFCRGGKDRSLFGVYFLKNTH